MGEMIDMIAHQWLAQVNIMNMKVDMTQIDIKDGYINNDEIDKFLVDQRGGFSHLTQTLNEFRGFFTQNNKLEKISLLKILQSVQILLKDTLVKNMISLEVFIDESIEVNIIPNEFKHILINLIQNSIDAFNESNIENREITVKSYKKEATTMLEYYDNAGGIDEKKIDKVFEPRYTTKTTGTGMGMYLSKLILDKIGASIKVQNDKSGIRFVIGFDRGVKYS
ncbi:MAG: ATP-binding protein [Campylobacterota bacterium]|nr:ATP-binding protein [Campylobacterota bacterium]